TGYPTEMLELGMDMEADLGIDSIKRVEILGAIQELYPDLPKANPEELAELRTLGQIINYLHSNASGVALPTSAEVAVAPVLTTTVLTNSSPVSSNGSKVIQETLAVSTATEPISHNDSKAGEEILAVSTPSEPVITPTFAPSLSIDITDLSQSLLAIVSDKTGYPAQMLELDMDMEADLGIDSIKRVEILGAVQELYPDLPKANPEELAELRTLGQIVEYLQQQAVTEKKTLQDEFYSQQPELKHNIQRSLVRLKVLPEPDFLDFTLPDKHIGLLTDDGSFTTPKLAKALKERGWKVVVLSFPQSLIANPLPLPEGISRVLLDNLSEEHLKQQLAAITANYGPIAAFIHLNPSHHDEHSDKVRFLEVEKALLKHVFFIAKHLKKSLNEAARQGRSCFLTVARLDGGFGLGRKTNFGVISAGLFGLTKSVNLEWESVFCRALDLSPDLDAEQSTQSIIAELHDPNRLIVEVGRSSQERVTLVCEKPTVTQRVNHIQSQIPPTSVFLVSGGAKGITAQCVIKLAKRYQCRFILLGRSSIAESEPTWASSCSSESELKKRIMEELLAKGEKPTPAMVQKQFKAIVSKREVEKTLSAIAQAGGQAEYISVDVIDTSALQEKLAAAVQRLGPVTGIIHGAGNIADKLIEKKSEQDFETVYAAKVKGLENLLGCVNAAQLDYLVLFSSVVGFYGNVGQVDYAIANEILSKSAHLVKHHHPNCHVVAINWGPWEEGGMVTPEFKKVAEKQNVELIPLEIGTQLLLDELAPANHDIVQVVVGSPMLWPPAQVSNFELQTFRTHRKLTSEANPFLYDHEIGGYPVLPATCALAWIFNTCEQLYPGYKLVRCTNYRILKGIPFDETLASEYILELKEIAKTEDNEIEFDAKIFSVTSAGKLRYHFSVQPKIRQQLPPAPTYNSLNLTPDQAMLGSRETFYQNGDVSLFHGPAFQGVEKVLNVSPEKLTVQCVVQSIGEKQQGQFPVQIFNPRIADVQLHASWLWLQHFYQSGALPAKVEKIEQYAAIPCDEPFYVSLEVKSKTESSLVADVIAHNREGQIYSCLYGAQATIFPLPFNFRGK
ncbi:MAG TPA: SDR family NAD(P)-dependent oxidoreductase, partial [Coleofasciculaceae cyanobacterium]